MHKSAFTSSLILATGILLTTLSAQGMRGASLNFYPDPFNTINLWTHYDGALRLPAFVNPPSPEELKELSLLAEQHNQNNALFLLPKEILDHIFSYCHIQGALSPESQVKSLEKSIETFLHLSATCKNFNKLLTLEIIGSLCKNYALDDKNEALENLLRSMNNPNYRTKRLPGLILAYAGADLNTGNKFNGCLLSRAVNYSDERMVEKLFQHHANPNVENSINAPLFMSATTIKIAKMFIDNNVDIHVNYRIFGTNVLWYICIIHDCKCLSGLIELYLKYQVDATQLDPGNNSCLLHELAQVNSVNNIDDFLNKCALLLNAMPKKMVNTLNENKQTPVDIAIASLKKAKRYGSAKKYEAFEQLIALYRSYGGLTAQELAQQTH